MTSLVKEDMYYTYLIQSNSSNRIYIGKTNNIEKRLKDHMYNSRSGIKRPLYDWMRKYENDIVLSVIEEATDEHICLLNEMFWIEYYSNLGAELLNLTTGGDGVSGYKHTSETKSLIAEKARGRDMRSRRTYSISPENQAKMREGCRNSTLYQEKQKRVAKELGKKHCKRYRVTDVVTSEEFIVHDLSSWCKDRNINKNSLRACMHQAKNRKGAGIRTHKNLKIELMED